ncbi:MAG: hypothetical protein ACXW0Q_13580 [Methylovulum sp.]
MINITESELKAACNYLQNQFAAHSWWPKEQPDQALHEFKLMQGSTTALNIWCQKWLDSAQLRQLEKAIRH